MRQKISIAMMKYAVVSLILLLNGVYGDENGGSKVADSTTTSTTIDLVIELILSSLLQKEGETVCKEDVKQYLLLLADFMKSQKQELHDMKEREKVQLVAEVKNIKDKEKLDLINMKNQDKLDLINMKNQDKLDLINMKNQDKLDLINMKDREISLLKEDIKTKEKNLKRLMHVEKKAENALKLAAYYGCAIKYRTQIEGAMNRVIEHPKKVNMQERFKIHRKVQEERSSRKKVLGEILSSLGLCAKEYIRLSENNLGKDSTPLPSKPKSDYDASKTKPPLKVESPKKMISAKISDIPLENKPKPDNDARKSTTPLVTETSTTITSIESTTKDKSTTIHFKTINTIKKKFKSQIKRLIKMKIVDSKDVKDTTFISIELNWLSEQHQYSDEIWKRWEGNVRLWNYYYQNVWKTNVLSAPEIPQFSSSLRKCLFDQRYGLLNEWGVFNEGIRNYAALYDNQTLKAPFSEFQMKCQWILYTEEDTFLHRAIEMLLVRLSESEKKKMKDLHSLYYKVCYDTSQIFNNLTAGLVYAILNTLNVNFLDCPVECVESPDFDKFLRKIAHGDECMTELSLILKDYFFYIKKKSDVPAVLKSES